MLTFLLLTACKPPPPAPEGLDDSTTFLLRNFYADDATFAAGIQGFVEWYETDGAALVGEEATLDTVDAYTIGDLSPDDIAQLPVEENILESGDEDAERIPRDLSRAKGVVSLAEMDCTWKTAEALLVRPDQHVVFSEDFEGYQREYVSSREAFENATASEDFAAIRDPLDPFADGFDPGPTESALLFTKNVVDPSTVLTVNLESYDMNLDVRHGVFDLGELSGGEPVGVFAIVTYNIDAAYGGGGNNGLLQSFSVEINVERPGDQTLRMLAVWAESKGGGIEPDSAIALNFAVNKALASSERLSGICAGDIEITE
jgi:hypothetical protein